MNLARTIIALAVAAVVTACDPGAPQLEVAYASLAYDNGRYTFQGEPFTGTATEHHPNGKLAKSFGFKDGTNHGVARQWTEDGTLVVETHFENGTRHGKNTYWNPDGSLQKEQVYDQGNVTSETWHTVPGGKPPEQKQ